MAHYPRDTPVIPFPVAVEAHSSHESLPRWCVRIVYGVGDTVTVFGYDGSSRAIYEHRCHVRRLGVETEIVNELLAEDMIECERRASGSPTAVLPFPARHFG
jgi:hypothetical protein